MRMLESNARSKHTPHATNSASMRLIPVGVPRSIDLLRGQSSSACFLRANRSVERSKLVPAVSTTVVAAMRLAIHLAVVPVVAHSNKFISKNS